jgi:hypothetical protein
MKNLGHKGAALFVVALLCGAGCENPAGTEKSGEAAITALSVMGTEGTIAGNTVTVHVPWGTDLASLAPELSVSAGAAALPASGEARDFSAGPVEYRVNAEDGTTALYMVRVFGVDGRHPAPFGSVAEMAAYLETFQGETGPEDPIYVVLDERTDDLDGPIHSNPSQGDPLGGVFDALNGRHVSLDISAWRGRLLRSSDVTGLGAMHLGEGTESRLNRDKLAAIKLPDTLETIGDGVFANVSGLQKISFPASLKTIEYFAFKNCAALEELDLSGTKITGIQMCLFENCFRLKRAILPGGVSAIDWAAFSNCTSLKTVTLLNPQKVELVDYPAESTKPFYECIALEHIYVPGDLVESYRADPLWKPWADKIGPIPEEE